MAVSLVEIIGLSAVQAQALEQTFGAALLDRPLAAVLARVAAHPATADSRGVDHTAGSAADTDTAPVTGASFLGSPELMVEVKP